MSSQGISLGTLRAFTALVSRCCNAEIHALSLRHSPASRYAHQQLGSFAQTVGERALHTPGNPISIGMTISHSSRAAPGPSEDLEQGQKSSQNSEHDSSKPSKHEGEALESCVTEQSSRAAALDSLIPSDSSKAEHEARQGPMLSASASSRSEQGSKASSAAAGSSLRSLPVDAGHEVPEQKAPAQPLSMLGAMLFKRGVSGTRVVAQGKVQSIAGHSFQGYGAHHSSYPHTYLTFAAALGTTKQDVDAFLQRLRVCLEEFRRV